MHIGSVQIGIKPLSKVGLNNSMLVCLRDGRITDYKESIIGLAESSLTYGPIYFQCYPNFQISLKADKHKEKCLVVDVQIHNYNLLKDLVPINLFTESTIVFYHLDLFLVIYLLKSQQVIPFVTMLQKLLI